MYAPALDHIAAGVDQAVDARLVLLDGVGQRPSFVEHLVKHDLQAGPWIFADHSMSSKPR